MPFLNLGDTDIYYETAGEGPAFLLNSATAWHGEAWKLYQVPEFSRDHRVITYDQRGTGRSKTRSEDFSGKRLAEDAVALLDHLKVKSTITLGHSNGGRIAMTLATDYPGLVNRLILASSGTTHHGPPGVPIKMCVQLVDKGYEKYVLDSTFAVGFTESYYKENKAVCDRFVAVRMANLPSLDNFLRHVVNRQASDVLAKLSEIKVPTLVMAGDDEDHHAVGMTHLASAKLLADRISDAKFVLLPGQGHYYLFVASEIANRTIRDFLKSSS